MKVTSLMINAATGSRNTLPEVCEHCIMDMKYYHGRGLCRLNIIHDDFKDISKVMGLKSGRIRESVWTNRLRTRRTAKEFHLKKWTHV